MRRHRQIDTKTSNTNPGQHSLMHIDMRIDPPGRSRVERHPRSRHRLDLGDRDPLARQRLARPHPLVFHVLVARIIAPADTTALKHRANIRPQRRQQRSGDPDAAVKQHDVGDPGHGGGRALAAHGKCLALIVERVAGHNNVSAEFDRRLGEQPVAGVARRRHDAGLRLGALPDLGDMGNIKRSAKSSDIARLISRLRTQRVVDGRGAE